MLKNLVYFGSPAFSAEILESVILSGIVNVVGVVTTPDTPQGRKQTLTPSPVSLVAQKYDLPVYKPTKLDDDNLAHLKLLRPDIFLVVSFGKIVPKNWLEAPAIGTFNIHFSLLPKYRGALCISEAIKNMDQETGVTLMEMDEKLDHGPLISQSKISIDISDDVTTLTTKLTHLAEAILIQNLPEICAQNYSKTPQDESLATYTPSHRTVSHSSAFIPWEIIHKSLTSDNRELTSKLHALVRSLNPEPGAWTKIGDNEIKLLRTSLLEGRLVPETVQLTGKTPISWKQFLSGHPLPQ